MSDRIQWVTLYVVSGCSLTDPNCTYGERIESPNPDQQKDLIRRARQHALRTGHYVGIERGQTGGMQA